MQVCEGRGLGWGKGGRYGKPRTRMRYVQLQVRGGPWARGPGSALGWSGTTEVAVFRF